MTARGIPTIRPFLRIARCRVSHRYLATTVTTDKPSTPPPSAKGRHPDPRIGDIVNEISALSLLQAADLVSELKTRLNIQEVASVAAAPLAAPVAAVETPPEEKPREKTIFNVKLESFEATSKPKVIREVKALLPNLNLIDAKKFVESVPKLLKENLPKEDAEKLKATFEKLGAKLTLE